MRTKKMNDTETKKAFKKKNVLVDVGVEADLSEMLWCRHYESLEERAKDLSRACKDFEVFLRDHRSQDMVRLKVIRKYADLCSACGSDEFEYNSDTKELSCVGCGAIIKGEELQKLIEDKEDE